MPDARYGTPKYRAWNRERMRMRRENAVLHRRELNLLSIRRVDKTIVKYAARLKPPHQEAT
jgi:hypothetical protein